MRHPLRADTESLRTDTQSLYADTDALRAMSLPEFRHQVHAWLLENCPLSMRQPYQSDAEIVWGGTRATFPHPDARLWLERMASRGWTAPTWPIALGGGGLSEAQANVLLLEMKALRCRTPLASLGIWMLGPVLLELGSKAQQEKHLPPMASGAIRWCQGFSEPGAGSDLASLSCRAVQEGDHLVVTGQKVWTSHADRADWMFALVRTDPTQTRHRGITFILLDMRSPGVTVRPIELISGSSPFCETFLEQVRVPLENVVGALGEGWSVAKAVLQHERALIGARVDDSKADGSDDPLLLARQALELPEGPLPDPDLRDQITRLRMDDLCYRITQARTREAAENGRAPGFESSIFKLVGSELKQRKRALQTAVLGYEGLGWEGPGFSEEALDLTRKWLRTRASTIEGGTSEIQLNIIAKRVLGLPDA